MIEHILVIYQIDHIQNLSVENYKKKLKVHFFNDNSHPYKLYFINIL